MNLQEELKALKKRIAELEGLAKEEREFPQEGHWYWHITSDAGIGINSWEGGLEFEKEQLSIGNVFRTKEQADFAVEKLKVEAELRKFGRPFKEDEYNYFIQIHPSHNNIVVESDDFYQTQGAIYFESTTIANEAIDAIGENRIKKYIFRVED